MTNAVFYSVCPYGTGTIETGDGTIEITSGVATLSVAQTGNIGAGVCIEYNSLECWIAPNRIAFTSGGTTELLTGTKIEGGTSGATGIVRAIEVTSGTWAGGDAAGWIYFESTTGTWNSSEQINRTKPTSSTNIATTNGSLEGNIGDGNTEFVVKSATGGAASNQTSTSVTSVHHEWASLADFETYFIDSSHINNTSLVSADVVAYACCYYDHANPTTNPDDNAVTIDFGATGADNYLQIYTPVGEAESINSQRHDGEWNTNKYYLSIATSDEIIDIKEDYVWVDGPQFYRTSNDVDAVGDIEVSGQNALNKIRISNCIIKKVDGTVGAGMKIGDTEAIVTIWNTIIYVDGAGNTSYSEGILNSNSTSTDIYNCIISGFDDGIERDGGTIIVKNSAVFNKSDNSEFDGTLTVDYCAYDGNVDGTPTITNSILWENGATDWNNVFTDYANEDFSLKDYTAVGIAIIEQGTPLLTEGVWRDIIGTERDTTNPDIGAFEYVSAGPSISIPVIMHHYRQQRL